MPLKPFRTAYTDTLLDMLCLLDDEPSVSSAKQMYPTPPATASSSSADGDTIDDSAYHEDYPFPRISKPIEHIRDSYDCVAIGSGYGGSIAASRMARAGETVCLLERGEERWPGEYPTGTIDTMKQYRVTGDLIPSSFGGIGVNIGNPTGMFHLILGHGQNVIVCITSRRLRRWKPGQLGCISRNRTRHS